MLLKKMRWITMGLIIVIAAGIGVYWLSTAPTRAEAKQVKTFRKKLWIDPIDSTREAPDFTLTDQRGKQVNLSQYKGKVVILQFMDPVCTDICPIVSQEMIDANKDMKSKSSNVVYVAVNVNQYHESQADTLAFSKEHGLESLPNWHFVSGNTDTLKKIWKEYGVSVVPNPTGDVQHTSVIYFINGKGTEKYTAYPDKSKADISEWGKGISFFAQKIM